MIPYWGFILWLELKGWLDTYNSNSREIGTKSSPRPALRSNPSYSQARNQNAIHYRILKPVSALLTEKYLSMELVPENKP